VLKHLKERRQSEDGFTLIELMVVVLIMGILMAIAIPTFLATQGSAHDAAAKSNATNAFTNEKAYFEDNQAFLGAGSGGGGKALDPNLPWGIYGAAPAGTVTGQVWSSNTLAAANVGTDNSSLGKDNNAATVLLISAASTTKNCFYIYDDESNSSSPVIAYAESSGGCFTPTAPPGTVGSGNAGQHIVAGAAPAATNWYTSW
jgi:prepilin-type N-terminal cleavage/methylation domain-containing protein